MPKISIPIKSGFSSESVVAMAEQLGKMTGTVVECESTLVITAAEPVLKALAAIAPMAKGRRGKYNKTNAEEIPTPETDPELS